MQQLAIVGFGSLLWDPQNLAPYGMAADRWQADGPIFPIEFSRISTRRLGALTLCIDPMGSPCQTYWIAIKAQHQANIHAILTQREGKISWANRMDARPATPADQNVWEWLQSQPAIDQAIWTSQGSNFTERMGQAFSVSAAMQYLAKIADTDPEGFDAARTYIHRAPIQTQTPLRTAFELKWPPEEKSSHA